MTKEESHPIVIFDGVCNFCDASVNFIMDHDPEERFRFTASQHDSGKELLGQHGVDTESVETLFLLEDGQLYERSTAALRIARHLEAPWSWAYRALIWIPKGLRDMVYNFIARHRYRIFGKKESCRMPTPEERARFI